MPVSNENYINLFRTEWDMTIKEIEVGYEADGFFVHPEEVNHPVITIAGPRRQ